MEAPGEWTSIAEAARRFGVTRRAVRDRIVRGTVTVRQGNRTREVFVPAGVVPVERPGRHQGGDGELRQRLAEAETALAVARRELELLRERLADERERRRELRADRDRLAGLLAASLARPPSLLERLVRAVRRP